MRLIERYLGQREELASNITNIQDAAATEDRDLTEAEEATANDLLRQVEELDGRIETLKHADDVLAAHADTRAKLGAGGAQPKQPLTVTPREVKYDTFGGYMVDLVRSLRYPGGSGLPAFSADAAQRVTAALGRAVGDVAAGDHVTADDATGLLPINIVGDIYSDLDPTRPLLDAIGVKDLGGTPGSTFNRPTITGYHDSGAGKQPNQKGEGQGGEVVIGSKPFTKESFLRWMNVAFQVIDWTSPAAWDVLMQEFLNEYSLDTEIDAETKLLAGTSQTETAATDDYPGWVEGFYAAYTKIVSAGDNHRRGSLRIPDLIVASLDMDASIGALIDIATATAQKVDGTPLGRFGGLLVNTQRVMAPGLPAGTVLYGRKSGFEYYETRKGFVQGIEPKVFGVEVAYGGYAAGGFMDASLWCKLATA